MLALLEKAAKLSFNGNYTQLADSLGCPRPSLYAWHQIPAAYVLKLEAITDGQIPRWEARPDLYPEDEYKGKGNGKIHPKKPVGRRSMAV